MNLFKQNDFKERKAVDVWVAVSGSMIENRWKKLIQENTEKDINNHMVDI